MKRRRNPKIQLCPRCGMMRCYHADGLYECPVPDAVLDGLRAFRRTHGRNWRATLVKFWDDRLDPVPEVRKFIDRRTLYRVDLDASESAAPAPEEVEP